jgi:cytochrome c551/c552
MGRGALAAIVVLVTAQIGAAPQTAPAAGPAADSKALLSRYCVSCHDGRLKTGGLALDGMNLADIPAGAEVWEKVIRKVRAGMMPPAGMPRPADTELRAFAASLEKSLDDAAAVRPGSGRALIHRLNRAEYANAIRDLVALDVDAASLLPPDDAAYGFDNIADALGVSPLLLDRYLSAAGRIAALAVGNRKIEPASQIFRLRQDASQDVHVEGLPLGTFGGLAVQPSIPLDAEYRLQVKLFRTNTATMRGLENPHQLEITVDGRRVLLADFGGEADFKATMENPTTAGDDVEKRFDVRLPLKAGVHTVTAAFLATAPPSTVRLQPFVRSSFDTIDPSGHPHVESLTVTGPFNATGAGDTPSRRRIFVCRPSSPVSDEPCARRIIAALARKAYRRPVTPADLDPILAFYRTARDARGFEEGIEVALQRILTDPEFVFRAERDPEDAAPGTVYRVSDLELASRLSFFLWSSIPDEQLLGLASQGRLHVPAVLDRQVARMLADPRSAALVQNFASQWLYLRNLRNQQPNSMAFPDFDDNLRRSFRRETELLFESIMREDRNVVDLMTADYTFVNERLARHYGIPNVYGSQFRRVPISDPARKGLLGQGSILMVTSHSDRTSPPVRGKWVLENLLGTPPPAPPANVPPLPETPRRDTGTEPTMRERMEQHRANPACAACHRIMDPIGFALENFDAVGAWRAREGGSAGTPIDASGQLVDGTKVDGVVALREALVREPEAFVRTMTEKLLTYALGRGLSYADMPAVRGIVRGSAAQNYRFSSLVSGIVASPAFQMRTASPRE